MHAYIYYNAAVRTPINTQTVCGFMQIYNILCNLFIICLQKVYKISIESPRRGWYNRDRKQGRSRKHGREATPQKRAASRNSRSGNAVDQVRRPRRGKTFPRLGRLRHGRSRRNPVNHRAGKQGAASATAPSPCTKKRIGEKEK